MTQYPPGVCTLVSSGSLGWVIRVVIKANGHNVTFNDNISFSSPVFRTALVGDTWAVKCEPSICVYGAIEKAILLERIITIKPCPFCGKEANIEYKPRFTPPSIILVCKDCNIGFSETIAVGAEKRLIERWNERKGCPESLAKDFGE